MRDINITGGNVTINIFDGGTHTHNYGQSPEPLKVPCSQELVTMLNIIARILEADASELAQLKKVLEGIQKDWSRVSSLPASMNAKESPVSPV